MLSIKFKVLGQSYYSLIYNWIHIWFIHGDLIFVPFIHCFLVPFATSNIITLHGRRIFQRRISLKAGRVDQPQRIDQLQAAIAQVCVGAGVIEAIGHPEVDFGLQLRRQNVLQPAQIEQGLLDGGVLGHLAVGVHVTFLGVGATFFAYKIAVARGVLNEFGQVLVLIQSILHQIVVVAALIRASLVLLEVAIV